MTRKTKRAIPPAQERLTELMSKALSESHRTKGMTASEFFEDIRRSEPETVLPPMIDSAYMTHAEYHALTTWAHIARDMNEEIQRISEVANWDKAVKSAYVATELETAQTPDHLDVIAVDRFSKRVLQIAKERVRHALGAITHYIPCYLFDVPRKPSFSIGPVQFIAGSQVPARILQDCAQTPKWFENYAELSAHNDPRTDARIRHVREMSQHPWIAVVRIDGCEPMMSKRRANDAARLALAGVSLNLHPKTSQQVSVAADWALPPVTRTMGQVPGHDVFVGSEINVPQVRLGGEVEEYLAPQIDYLTWLGNLLSDAMSGPSAGTSLRKYWLNSLYWYYTACTERSDARATICFSSAFESLADGDGADAISVLLEVVLGAERRRIIAPELGWTLEQSVGEIYTATRSEVVHGGRFVIFGEYHSARGIAAELCRYTLLTAQRYLRQYESRFGRRSEADSKQSFLRWIRATRSNSNSNSNGKREVQD